MRLQFRKEDFDKIDRILELLILLLTGWVVFVAVINHSMLKNLFDYPYKKVALWLILAGIIRMGLSVRKNWRLCLCAIVSGLIYLGIYVFNRKEDLLLVLAALTIASIGINYEKFLKLQVSVVGFTLTTIIFQTLLGANENLVYITGEGLRSSGGTIYPTDFASFFFYVILFIWVAFPRVSDLLIMLMCIPLFYIAIYFTISDTCTLSGIAFVVLLLLSMAMGMVKQYLKNYKDMKCFRILNAVVEQCIIFSFLLFGILMFALMLLYYNKNGLAIRLNAWLSGRLGLSVKSFLENGIKLFGSPITQVGNGGTLIYNSDYNFVDSTYPLLLIKYGILGLVMYSFFWVRITWIAMKNKNYRLALGAVLIGFHSLSEHHFPEIEYNLLMAIPFADYNSKKPKEIIQCNRTDKIICGCVVASICTLGVCSTRIIAYFRTVFQQLGWGIRKEPLISFKVSALILMIPVIIIAGIYVLQFRRNIKKYRVIGATAIMIGLIIMVGIGLWGRGVKKTAEEQYGQEINGLVTTITELRDLGSGKIYGSWMQELLIEKKLVTKLSFWQDEDLARKKDATIITNRDTDWLAQFSNGFLYLPISERFAIYTNDWNIIDHYNTGEFVFRGCYSEVKEAKYPAMAGGFPTLHSGSFEANYYLVCNNFSERNNVDEDVCMLTVLGDLGKRVLRQVTVSTVQFSEDGTAVISVNFPVSWITNSVIFSCRGLNEYEVKVEKILYQNNPLYDSWEKYNANNHLIEISYHDTNGELSPNYTLESIQKNIWEEDKLVETQYYDKTGEPVVTLRGYASVKITYDEKNRKLAEEYFDEKGNVIQIREGYSKKEWIYSSSGSVTGYRYYDNKNKLLFVKIPKACLQWSKDY